MSGAVCSKWKAFGQETRIDYLLNGRVTLGSHLASQSLGFCLGVKQAREDKYAGVSGSADLDDRFCELSLLLVVTGRWSEADLGPQPFEERTVELAEA